jgi:hypothetical protein
MDAFFIGLFDESHVEGCQPGGFHVTVLILLFILEPIVMGSSWAFQRFY